MKTGWLLGFPAGMLMTACCLAGTPEPPSDVVSPPPATPLPAAVTGVAQPVLTLNGTWKFSSSEGAEFKPIEVPGEWAMQGFNVPSGGFAIYQRSFDLPDDWKAKDIKLRFDAVHAVCRVSINGIDIGGHEGGFVPFELDATAAVRPGRNEIAVRVQSESIADSIACMDQYAAHQVGGIVRKVTLFCVPKVHLAALWHETVLRDGRARLTIHSEIANRTADGIRPVYLLRDPAGKSVGTAIEGGESTTVIAVTAPRLWTSETPALYSLEARFGDEIVRQHVGLREIRVDGNHMLINGMPVKFRGICRHEVHPLRGRSLTPELCRKDAELFRAANVNLVRTSHYPPSEEFLTACDELGVFVECEAAICWINHGASPIWKTWNAHDPKFLPYLLRANLDNVTANRGHPSIVIWSLANESQWSSHFSTVNDEVKRLDPSRPTSFHDQCWNKDEATSSTADIAVYHYPSENNPDEWSKLQRPVWFGEYAHVECYNRRELVTDPGIREDWGRPLARMVDLMWQQPGCLGGAIWSGVDDVFHMPDGNLKGYGHWGPIDGWRRKKPEFYGLRTAYSPIRILESRTPLGGEVKLQVQNRLNFTNLSDIDLRWKSGTETGRIHADIPPHASGEITIRSKNRALGTPLVLTAIDPRGVTLTGYTVPGNPQSASIHSPEAVPKVEIVSNELLLTSGGTLRMPPPMPMVLPLNGEGGSDSPGGRMLANEIEPFTPVSANWQPRLDINQKGELVISGETEDAETAITIVPQTAGLEKGLFALSYQMKIKKDINPRQWGLVFTLPRGFDTLEWTRKDSGQSAQQLGRPQGSAVAHPVNRGFVEEPGVQPDHDWILDANALGSADFRSTRTEILTASLKNNEFRFAIFDPAKSCAVRTWIDGEHVRMLVAGFNTGGSDHFFATHYAAERKPLKKGDVVRGWFLFNVLSE